MLLPSMERSRFSVLSLCTHFRRRCQYVVDSASKRHVIEVRDTASHGSLLLFASVSSRCVLQLAFSTLTPSAPTLSTRPSILRVCRLQMGQTPKTKYVQGSNTFEFSVSE